MKLFVFGIWMVLYSPNGICQETKPVDERLNMYTFMPDHKGVHLTATSIERETPVLNWRPAVIHLKGNAEIRISFPKVADPSQKPTSTSEPGHLYLVLHADAADYHQDTGAIDARGDVHVTFEPRK